MEKTEFLWWPVPAEVTGLPEGVKILVLESLYGKQRIFVPGRRCQPQLVANLHQQVIAFSLQAIMDSGVELDPRLVVGVPIFTEGIAAPFAQAFADVWPNQIVGGVSAVWSKRRPLRKELRLGDEFLPFAARVIHYDDTALRHLLGNGGTLVFFDIGATGSTIEAVVPQMVASANGCVSKAIFASPCTSLQAIRAFVRTAVASGLSPKGVLVVASEGIFGLGSDGTALSLQLPGAITSLGNTRLSRDIYRHSQFCHIGAGGLAATCYPAYLEELREDERRLGRLRSFGSLEQAMNHAGGLRWPEGFGSPF